MESFKSTAVSDVYENYPLEYRTPLLALRQLIYDRAKDIDDVGTVEESLKWGQPSYVVKKGTPIRLDRFGEDKIAMLFHCQTTLIETFRNLFSEDLEFSKNRAIILDPKKELPVAQLSICIEIALTYHKNK